MATTTGASSEGAVTDRRTHGKNELARERVSEIQRSRMVTGMVEIAAERGVANVTVAHVVARSGVSRRTFYEVFEDREDCFVSAFDDGIARVGREVALAYEQGGRWREQIRSALIALLSFLDREPDVARLLVVEALGAGPRALEHRSMVLGRLIAAVDGGREEAGAKRDAEPPPLTAEGVVGAVLALLHSRLLTRGPERLLELTNSLMGMIVLPYLGPAAARKELDRPMPETGETPTRSAPDPLRELEMRLTYRTVRVLMSVAANPGSSNRTIADGAGIADQGQISKLLARLRSLCLIENTGHGSTRGEPNAWTLTTKGWEVHGVIANQMSSS
jgi:AcrR family transcriptional regulator